MRTYTKHFQTFVFALLLGFGIDASAQCTIMANALEDLTLTSSVGAGTGNRSGVAFNPSARLYYSVNAGSSAYPIDTFTSSGTLLDSTTAGIDYRGAWWNPNAELFEGNGYGASGVFAATLQAVTNYPIGDKVQLFEAAQPDNQSVGDLDYDAGEILYFFEGFIHRYSRTDNSFLGSYAVLNLPVATTEVNSNTVVYTGCAGQEIGLYDPTNQQLLFVNKVTGQYVGASQLPATAPQRSSFGMSYARGRFWLYDEGAWSGYLTIAAGVGVEEQIEEVSQVEMYPNPVRDVLTVQVSEATTARISNLLGQTVAEWQTLAGSPTRVNVASYAAGLYFLTIGDNNRSSVHKIVKID